MNLFDRIQKKIDDIFAAGLKPVKIILGRKEYLQYACDPLSLPEGILLWKIPVTRSKRTNYVAVLSNKPNAKRRQRKKGRIGYYTTWRAEIWAPEGTTCTGLIVV